MLEVNPKKFKKIQNKSIPSPLRPKFRNSNESNMYFLSKGKFNKEKKQQLIFKIIIPLTVIILLGLFYYFTN
tara:strand:+ start:230 stop:445 length:216 start_codon:yes stop_codon:yes gene_type:complete